MSFALVLEGAIITAFVAILMGGRAKRENGWKVLVGLVLICGLYSLFSSLIGMLVVGRGGGKVKEIWANVRVIGQLCHNVVLCHLWRIFMITMIGSLLGGSWI